MSYGSICPFLHQDLLFLADKPRCLGEGREKGGRKGEGCQLHYCLASFCINALCRQHFPHTSEACVVMKLRKVILAKAVESFLCWALLLFSVSPRFFLSNKTSNHFLCELWNPYVTLKKSSYTLALTNMYFFKLCVYIFSFFLSSLFSESFILRNAWDITWAAVPFQFQPLVNS